MSSQDRFIIINAAAKAPLGSSGMLFNNTLKRLSKRDILEKCPDISTSTIEVTLPVLLKEGYVIKTCAGEKSAYIRNTE